MGIDIGGTNLRVAVVSPAGEVVEVRRQRHEDHSVAAVCKAVSSLAADLLHDDEDVTVGVGLAGAVYTRTGIVGVAPQLDWRDVPFGTELAAALGTPVRLVNDLSAISYAEAKVGAGLGHQHVACLFVGTGVGFGAVANGTLLEGSDGLGPELGHLIAERGPDARRCNCGQRGCIEAYLGGHHLPALVRETASALAVESSLAEGADADASAIEAAARAGDPVAVEFWRLSAERLAWIIATAIMTLEPEVLVLGGGVLRAAPSLVAQARAVLPRFAWASFLHGLEIRESALGDDAGLIGAALLGREEGGVR